MNAIFKFGLLGQLIEHRGKLSKERTPEMMMYLEKMDIGELNSFNLHQNLIQTLQAVEHEIEYYDASELRVNEVLDQWLKDTGNAIVNQHYPEPRDTAMVICALGNKGGDFDEAEGVQSLIEHAQRILNRYLEMGESDINVPAAEYEQHARMLAALERTLSQVDMFVTSRNGMVMGVEEFAPMDYQELNPVETTDWVTGVECGGTEDCRCGCAFDHPLEILQGMEDFLGGVESSSRQYFITVANLNGIRLNEYAGQEGPVYDAIKELGKKAYDAVMAAWKSIKEWFETSEDEQVKEMQATADDNKKAIQGMPKEGVKINDNAKNGIRNLATKADPTGELAKVVAGLNGPADASKVIDALMISYAKHSKNGAALTDQRKKAEAALTELKKASETVSGNDDNKDAAAAAKQGMQEKVKNARAAVSDAKKLVGQQNKITQGIKKAINGITPHIFIAEAGSGGNTDNNQNKGGNKKKGGKK